MDAVNYTQANRLMTIETPLGKDVLLMERFSGREMVNDLFEFECTVRAKRDDVTPQDIVGKTVNVTLKLHEDKRRTWNGLVTDLVEEPRLSRDLRQYVLTLRPELWLLSQRSDCRIWQRKTTIEIAKTLLSEHGLRAPDVGGVLNQPPAQEYSVQWNEDDLTYLLRRIEEDGLFYWIRQQDGKQTLVLADSPTGWDKGSDGGDGRQRFTAGSTDRDHITAWRRSFKFTPGKRAGRDWNFETPTTIPGSEVPSKVKLPRNGSYELYEYPVRALDKKSSERATTLRMQAVEHSHEGIAAISTVRDLAPGAKVTPYDLAHPEYKYETSVVMSIEHEAVDTTYETGQEEPSYSNTFTVLPARLPATPHRKTQRPRIEGSQIAIIAGPQGEEIYTDQYGRVKLKHLWDRRAKGDGTDTKWVRVAQPWAGTNWGSQVIPRIGMEAVISYENGDPDRPIVTALVPNPKQNVPYPLPANKSRMVLRSNTHKGAGYNEISMEDENGQQNLFMHAEKDQTVKVKNNQTERVDANAVHSIGQNHSMQVGANVSHQVGGGMTQIIGVPPVAAAAVDAATNAMLSLMGGGGMAQGAASIASAVAQAVDQGVLNQVIAKVHNAFVGVEKNENIDGNSNLKVKNQFTERVGHTKKIVVGNELIIEVGKSKISIRRDGTFIFMGKHFNFSASGPVQINGEVVDLNKQTGLA